MPGFYINIIIISSTLKACEVFYRGNYLVFDCCPQDGIRNQGSIGDKGS